MQFSPITFSQYAFVTHINTQQLFLVILGFCNNLTRICCYIFGKSKCESLKFSVWSRKLSRPSTTIPNSAYIFQIQGVNVIQQHTSRDDNTSEYKEKRGGNSSTFWSYRLAKACENVLQSFIFPMPLRVEDIRNHLHPIEQ